MRQTSVESYHTIKAEGLLGQLQLEVYETLYKHGPLTQGELWREYFFPRYQRPSITPRFAELERLGLVCAVGERPCRVTHMAAIVWDVTAAMPEKIERKKSSRQVIKELQRDLAAIRRGLELLL